MTRGWTRRRTLRTAGVIGIAGLAGCSSRPEGEAGAVPLGPEARSLLNEGTLVTSTSCPCCHQYVDVLSGHDIDGLEVDERADYTAPKRAAGIPRALWSCHTITTPDYVFEGHLPLEVIESVATERPDVAAVALPGMPAGSPGMGGSKDGEFVVYAVDDDGSTREFARI